MYILIFCTYWLGNPEETYRWGAVRMSSLEKLDKFAKSLKRGFKSDKTVLLGMRIAKLEKNDSCKKIAEYGVDFDSDEMQEELEIAFDSLETVKNYKR